MRRFPGYPRKLKKALKKYFGDDVFFVLAYDAWYFMYKITKP